MLRNIANEVVRKKNEKNTDMYHLDNDKILVLALLKDASTQGLYVLSLVYDITLNTLTGRTNDSATIPTLVRVTAALDAIKSESLINGYTFFAEKNTRTFVVDW